MGAGQIMAVSTVPCSPDSGRPCPLCPAAKASSGADLCHAAGAAITFDVGRSFHKSFAQAAPFCMPAVIWRIGSLTAR
jgi:hypothetical protein